MVGICCAYIAAARCGEYGLYSEMWLKAEFGVRLPASSGVGDPRNNSGGCRLSSASRRPREVSRSGIFNHGVGENWESAAGISAYDSFAG